jgi:Mn-containing catalase
MRGAPLVATMIRRVDRIATELPPPSELDPAGAAAVQELMGGRFGEMSTFLNYIDTMLDGSESDR